MCINWKRASLGWVWGRKLLLWVRWCTGTGCLGKLQMPHTCQCSKPDWIRLWEIWSSRRCPCPWQGGWNYIGLWGPFQPLNILWFYSFDHDFIHLPGSCALQKSLQLPVKSPLEMEYQLQTFIAGWRTNSTETWDVRRHLESFEYYRWDLIHVFKLKYNKSNNKEPFNNKKSKEDLRRNTGRKIIFVCWWISADLAWILKQILNITRF